MHLVTLRITGNREHAAEFMAAHKAWLQKGFDDGIFLASGNLAGAPGGGILAHGIDTPTLQARLDADPFVIHGIVTASIIDIAVNKSDPRLAFLLENPA